MELASWSDENIALSAPDRAALLPLIEPFLPIKLICPPCNSPQKLLLQTFPHLLEQARNLERCALKAAKLQHGKLKALHTWLISMRNAECGKDQHLAICIFAYVIFKILAHCPSSSPPPLLFSPRQRSQPSALSSKPRKMRFEGGKTSSRKTENLVHLTYPHAECGIRKKSRLGHLWIVFCKSYPPLFTLSHPL